MKTFLLRPFDKILIREDPIYGNLYFTAEKLNDDLSHDRDKITSKDFPGCETPVQFLKSIVECKSFHQQPGKILICKQILRPGWIRIEAPKNISMDELWERAMQKVANDDFWEPRFLLREIKKQS